MTEVSAPSSADKLPIANPAGILREFLAAVAGAAATLPICLASAVLAFAPLGPEYLALAGTAGLYGFIFGGACAALVATSSFVISSPRASIALVQATLASILIAESAISRNPAVILASFALCVLLAGMWQIIFGVARIATVIKFTPHPVLAGFINGVALLIVIAQLRPQFAFDAGPVQAFAVRPAMLALIVCVAAVAIGCGIIFRRIPGIFAGFGLGILGFYLAKSFYHGIELGPTLGSVQLTIPPALPLLELWDASTRDFVLSRALDFLRISLALAVVATLESMLALRLAQQSSGITLRPVRDLVAQGVGNCVAGIIGGVAIAASPAASRMAAQSGGRTRFVGVAAALITFFVGVLLPGLLGAIPVAVLSGILLAVGILLFDKWSFQLVRSLIRERWTAESRRPLQDMSIVAAVMVVTAFYSIIAGVAVGIALACVIFIAHMSRPIVRRRHSGEHASSKRIRPAEDVSFLRASGYRRMVLELQGVLFFGNADDLSHEILDLLAGSDAVLLDFKGISDIDVSGAQVLRSIIQKTRSQRKRVLFCNVPEPLAGVVGMIVGTSGASDPQIFADRDSALEFVEEDALRGGETKRGYLAVLPLEQHGFLEGIDGSEMAIVAGYLARREFVSGEVICREGDDADRMWLLVKGSVSVRLRVNNQPGGIRIASLARGTVVGELALIEHSKRSATVVADEAVTCYELQRDAYERIFREHPQIANKLLANLARELARRVRRTSDELREATDQPPLSGPGRMLV